jgi:hydrogenase/urease accessory protein HupE
MRAPSLMLLVLGLLAWARPAAALGPAPHDLDRTHVDVRFFPDGTFQIDVFNPPEWLLDALEPLSPNPSATLLEGEAGERRLAELTGTFAEWIWLMFDGTRIEAFPEYIPAPPGPGADPSRPPMGIMRMRGSVPPGATRFSFAYGIANDPYPMLITAGDGTLITHWVGGPVESDTFEIAALTPPSRWSVVLAYLKLGFTHILPKGIDHILFVVGLYLLSTRPKPILAQVTTFTIAHTITLGLTMFGLVSLRSSIVEPLIALSIAYVAVENVFTEELKPWRLALVFGFGLLHGMGFAGVLGELGLPDSERVTGLLSFNFGVEGGQLAVIAAMLLTVGWFRDRPWYRARLVVPMSLAIAVVGLYWTISRIAQG